VKHENYLWLYCMTLPQPCESLNELTTDLKQNVDQWEFRVCGFMILYGNFIMKSGMVKQFYIKMYVNVRENVSLIIFLILWSRQQQ